MRAFVTAGAGFLLAVLWFDLMFDVQARGGRSRDPLPEEVLASIARYYSRVTTAARPMNRLVAATMVATLAAIVVEIAEGRDRAAAWVSLALAAAPIGLAGARVVPRAVRLGTRADSPPRQSELARSILRDHCLCAAGIAALLAVQLAWA